MAGTHEVHGHTQRKFLLIKLKKCFLHLTAGTHRLYLRTEGSACLFCEKDIHPVDSGTSQIWWLTCGPTKLTRTEGFVNLINK